MYDITNFLILAQQEGYVPKSARVAFHTIRAKLESVGYLASHTFYVYRTGKKLGGGAGGAESSRRLLVFSSPDDALAFAQRNRLRPTPRLVPLNLAQLLAVLVKHASIRKIIFTEEDAAIAPDTQIPTVLCLNRSELLDMLKEE